MPGLFNKTGEYAVQVVLLLASSHGAGPVPLHTLAGRLGAPPHFLGKILRMLRRKGLVVSRMGHSGGYLLGRPAEQITLDEVARSVQGSFTLAGCIIGLPECGETRPCPLCPPWTQSRSAINGFLKRQNIAELSAGLPASLALDGRVGCR